MSDINIDQPSISQGVERKNNSDKEENNKKKLLIEELGWSREETLKAYYRFLPFKEDWDYPGMEVYDEL